MTGLPIAVPPGLRAAELEPYRQAVQAELDRLTRVAEQWAATGQPEAEPDRTL